MSPPPSRPAAWALLAALLLGPACAPPEPSPAESPPEASAPELPEDSSALTGWDCYGYPGSYFVHEESIVTAPKGLLRQGLLPAWAPPSAQTYVYYVHLPKPASAYQRTYQVVPTWACTYTADCRDGVNIQDLQSQQFVFGSTVYKESRNVDSTSVYWWTWASNVYPCNVAKDACDNRENTQAQAAAGNDINQCACPSAAPYDWASVPGDRCYPCPDGTYHAVPGHDPGQSCVGLCTDAPNPQQCQDCYAGGGGVACRCNQLPAGPERDLCACVAWDGGSACFEGPTGLEKKDNLPKPPSPTPLPPGGQPGPVQGPNPCQMAVGDPVDVTTGAEILSHACMEVGDAGMPLSASFFYDSLRAASGIATTDIGPGWSTSYTRRAFFTGDMVRPGVAPSVLLYTEHGQSYEFTQSATNANEFIQPGTTRDWGYLLREPTTGELTHFHAQGGVDVYTASGRLKLARDRAGNELELTESTPQADMLVEVLHNKTTGLRLERVYRLLTFGTKQERKLVEVRDHAGNRPAGDSTPLRSVTLAYDTAGRLSRVVEVDGKATRYGYDSRNRITTICDRNQDPNDAIPDDCTTVTYDNDWRVTQERVTGGTVVTFNRTDRGDYNLEVAYTHPSRPGERHFQRYRIDSRGRVLRLYNLNSTTHFAEHTYDSLGRPTQTKDALGRITTYAYDAITGDLLTASYLGQASSGFTKTMTYNSDGQVLSVTRPDGVRDEFSYDALSGRMVEHRKVPVANSGLATQVWRYQYNAAGQRTAEQLPDGTWNTQSHDSRGHPAVSVLDANHGGNTGRLAITSSTTYDWRGNLVQEVDGQGRVTTRTYDAAGRVLSVTRPNPAGTGTVTTAYAYDGMGNPTRVTEDQGGAQQRITTLTYAPVGPEVDYKPVEVTDPLGQKVSYGYTLLGALEQVTEHALANRVTRLQYTPEQWPRAVVLADGRVEDLREYNAAGEVVATVDARGVRTQVTYDAHGRRQAIATGTTSLDGLPAVGLERRLTYDPVGRVQLVTGPGGRELTRYEYDGLGRIKAITNASGARSERSYDARDRVVGVSMNASGRAVSRSYDAVGRLVSETVDPGAGRLNQTHRYFYAHLGSGPVEHWTLKRVLDPNNNAREFIYGAAGNVVTVRDAAGGTWRQSHDRLGRLVRRTDALGITTDSTYDALGRQLSETRGGRTESWTWRADNQVASYRDMAGRTTTYTHDVTGRLTFINHPTGTTATPSASDVELRYTANDLLAYAGLSGSRGKSYLYDAANRPLLAEGDGTLTWYGYDVHGQPDALYYGHNFVVTRTVEAQGLFARPQQLHFGGGSATLSWNAYGEVSQVARGGGLTTTMTRDAAGRMTGLHHTLGTSTVLGLSQTYDAAGNLLRQLDGTVDLRATYDRLDRMTTVEDVLTSTRRGYTYDSVGNLLTADGATYAYDASAERLQGVAYTYDANGNLLSDGTSTFTYDTADRLVKSQRAGLTVDYGYDALGHLTRVVVNGLALELELDDQTAYPRVLTARAANGWRQHYVHGPGGVLARATGTAWDNLSTEYAVADTQGSVRRWVTPSGVTAEQRQYDAWGSVTQLTTQRGWRHLLCNGDSTCMAGLPASVDAMGLGYTGEWHNPDGTVFLRARVYHPALRRFLQRDRYPGLVSEPMSLNRYSYVENNPLRYRDPSGMCKTPGPRPDGWDPCKPDWSGMPSPYWNWNPYEKLRQAWGARRTVADIYAQDFLMDAETYGWPMLKTPSSNLPFDFYSDAFDHISFSAELTIRGDDGVAKQVGDSYEWVNLLERGPEEIGHVMQDLHNNHIGRLLARRMLKEGYTRDTPNLRLEIFKRAAELVNCNINPYADMENGVMLWPVDVRFEEKSDPFSQWIQDVLRGLSHYYM